MDRYAAFLRAINVGGRIAKKDVLQRTFSSLGLDRVETFLASGNVIFETASAAGLEGRIEAALRKSLGFEVATFVRSLDEICAVAAYEPFPAEESATLYIGFAAEPVAATALDRLACAEHAFHIHGREAYWLARIRMSESTLTNGHIEKALGRPATFRNRNTVQRIAAKWG
jgi:uncharacterized protein (DUF1697 family)